MKAGIFGKILPKLGLSNAIRVAAGERWQLWEGIEEHTFGQEKLRVVYLGSRVTWIQIPQIAGAIQKYLPSGSRFFVIVQNSADPASDLIRLAEEFGARTAFTVRQVLNRAITRTLGTGKADEAENKLFVEPDSQTIDYRRQPLKGQDPQKAIQTLTSWLTSDS